MIHHAEGFRYREADSAATDHHVTFNGVKLYVLEYGAVVAAFGADTTGERDVYEQVSAMADAFRYVVIGPGKHRLTTRIINSPMTFLSGAYVTVDEGDTLTMTRRIESPRQHIFRGKGKFRFAHHTGEGEDARRCHVSWFGAIPTLDSSIDQGPRLQRCADAIGNCREGVIEFDVGTYYQHTKVTLDPGPTNWLVSGTALRTSG